jgi:PleD family two-component response regulator
MSSETTESRPLLDMEGLSARLREQVARTRRNGGFVSVALLRFDGDAAAVEKAARGLRQHVRSHDLIAQRLDHEVLLVLPDSDTQQARRAAERLIGETRAYGAGATAGVATGFGEVVGGPEALVAAAEGALAAADHGQVRCSDAVPRPRVLVVDDDAEFARHVADTVTELGWAGESCADAVAALQRVRETPYYGIFVDLVLPKVSGSSILREFLARCGKHPAAVVMSGADAGPSALVEALSLGPVMFLGKPPSRADIEAALGMFRCLLPGARR